MKKFFKNKGAAMISVLIAITFIGILATSLLYMAYANYMTKVVRYNSQDNFYSVEFGLDEMASSLKQVAYLETDSNAAMDALVAAVDPDHNGKFSDNSGTIVANLMPTSSQDVNFTVTHDSQINPGSTVEYKADYTNAEFTLYGLKITGVGKAGTSKQDYNSNVALNLTIKFPFDAKSITPPMSDFSLISDSPYSSGGGDTFFTGCVYMQGVGSNGTCSQDSYQPAMDITAGMTCFQGYQNIVNGDIIIRKGGVLNVTGDLMVNGFVDIKSGGALICSGDIKTAYGIKTSGTSYLTKGISTAADSSLSWNALPDNSIKGGTLSTSGGIEILPAKYRVFAENNPWGLAEDNPARYIYADFTEGEPSYSWTWQTIPTAGLGAIDYAACKSRCSGHFQWDSEESLLTDAEVLDSGGVVSTPEVGGAQGLANSLFAKYVVVMGTNGKPMCLQIKKISGGGMSYRKPVKYAMASGTGNLMINGDNGVFQAPGDSVNNCLVMNLYSGGAQLKGTFINSMFLSETPITRDTSQLPIYMQRMDESLYQSMLDSYWIPTDGSTSGSYEAEIAYNNGQLPKTEYSESGGDSKVDCSGQGFVLTKYAQDPAGSIYGGTGAEKKTYYVYYVESDGSVTKLRKTFEYLNDGQYTNLVQLKNFLVDDPNSAIAGVFGPLYGGGSGAPPAHKDSIVRYDKWFKNKD